MAPSAYALFATAYFLLWCWDLGDREGKDALEVAKFRNASKSAIPTEEGDVPQIINFPKGVEGVRIVEFREEYKLPSLRQSLQSVSSGQLPEGGTSVERNKIGTFFRDRKTGREVPPAAHKALKRFKIRTSHYHYDDVASLLRKYGKNIMEYDVFPLPLLCRLWSSQKFEIDKYEAKIPLWSVGDVVEESEELAVTSYVTSSVYRGLFMKHFFAFFLGLFFAFVAESLRLPPPPLVVAKVVPVVKSSAFIYGAVEERSLIRYWISLVLEFLGLGVFAR